MADFIADGKIIGISVSFENVIVRYWRNQNDIIYYSGIYVVFEIVGPFRKCLCCVYVNVIKNEQNGRLWYVF